MYHVVKEFIQEIYEKKCFCIYVLLGSVTHFYSLIFSVKYNCHSTEYFIQPMQLRHNADKYFDRIACVRFIRHTGVWRTQMTHWKNIVNKYLLLQLPPKKQCIYQLYACILVQYIEGMSGQTERPRIQAGTDIFHRSRM